MFQLDKKIPNGIINKSLGIADADTLQKEYRKEQAALTMCGGLLGNCYLLSELATSVMVDTISKCKKKKWFKQDIKYNMNLALDSLYKTISRSINNSPTNASYMREVSDAIYDILKPDLYKLKNVIKFELDKTKKIEDTDTLSDIIIVEVLLKYINVEYDDVIEYMNTIYKAYYDSWYDNARCSRPEKLWYTAIDLLFAKHICIDIDLNNVKEINDGIKIIQQKMHSSEVSEQTRREASKYAEEGNGRELYNNSLKELGLIK